MSEQVIMPKSDWQEILDAYRAKTETTDLIKSGELAALIAAIEAGDTGVAGLTKVSGSFTPTSSTIGGSTATYTIEHGLGVVPQYVLVSLSYDDTEIGGSVVPKSTNHPLVIALLTPDFSFGVSAAYASTGNRTYYGLRYPELGLTSFYDESIAVDENQITFGEGLTCYFTSAATWYWHAWG